MSLGASSSSGRAQIYRSNPGGVWTESGDPVEVWNHKTMPSSIASPRAVTLGWIGGKWWLMTGSCS
ncbi:hypothetical protein [Planctomyces sp. SH-PL62]|uniref:hypothetical protein n=1 Tax=Planctomyces sp. SH-PL62 TaxID=1636152 RepID=UPI00078E92B8|nr:hypothetical protein [Planctomyces sp. SH-PL62]AMV41060.1 hypothetical protein VT85_26730 [Planctomyces sp. SH-PL62]